MVQIALIVLLVLVGTIPISGITHANAETEEVPTWVKKTLELWSNGEISNEEFVRAIDYLSKKGIVKISSTTDKELKRDVEYLKAKAEVFQQEVKELRDENEEYRILLKSQELNKSEQFPTSMSSIFDEYQALKKEVDRLRETNKRMSTNIDAWVSNMQNSEFSVSRDSNQEGMVQVKSEVIEQLNNLKIENKKLQNQITKLDERNNSYEDNIELLKMENENKQQLITILKEKNQENRMSANELIQDKESYESLITKLKNDNFIQKQKLIEYENKVKSFDETIQQINGEKTQTDEVLTSLKNQNTGYINAISQLENLNQEQKSELASITSELANANNAIERFATQIQDYETKIGSLEDENSKYQNKINQLGSKNTEYENKIAELESTNIEQRETLIGIMNDAEESNEFATVLNSRLSEFQKVIKQLEDENQQYKDTILELEEQNTEKNTSLISMKSEFDKLNQLANDLNSKVNKYENTIQVLEEENKLLKNDMIQVSDQDISEYESLVRQLQGEKSTQQENITMMKIEIEESNELIDSLNSKIINYQKQLSLFEEENSKYRNEISHLKSSTESQQESLDSFNNVIDESDEMIKLLSNKNKMYQSTIDKLKEENRALEKKVSAVTNENTDGLITISEIESENKEMRKQVELLQSEIRQKHEQIENLKQIQEEKDAKYEQIQAQISTKEPGNEPIVNTSNEIEKENDALIVELNYLKAKNLVNDEEIETLRAENEEYRVLLNLLKKGESSLTGIQNTGYDKIDEGQGVVVYNNAKPDKTLPSDWVSRVDNSKTYQIYIEQTPRWSKDMSFAVKEALNFWQHTANIQFEIVDAPSFGITSISWEKELKNGYDGYVVGQTDVTVGLGSSDCDGKWKAYSSESIKNILIHELGHTVGLDHAVSKSNIMYPMIHDAKFAPIEQLITIPQDESVFIKGCSFSADPVYKYNVQVNESKTADIFFVPSENEKYKVDSGMTFDYYSDINCLGIEKSYINGACKVADSAGMLIINSGDQGTISLKIYLEEK
ncbi:Matrixin domain containing protein [Marine Group I thaumarchaeote SCGC AAA799-P11]|uniref:Matrixin domain containing protein n=1 Tax=Marine Group I thaumarchaeote SCGC AAA799-P11 TaxID=1502295 RepID=A0A087S132_9ARCH|nr:Matrixin domain containing protein [Marine Group I thaumarchaeote SCGC AAA799-P11]